MRDRHGDGVAGASHAVVVSHLVATALLILEAAALRVAA
jgi:hypothetical protein